MRLFGLMQGVPLSTSEQPVVNGFSWAMGPSRRPSPSAPKVRRDRFAILETIDQHHRKEIARTELVALAADAAKRISSTSGRKIARSKKSWVNEERILQPRGGSSIRRI